MPSPERTPYTLRELAEVYRAAQERLGLYAAVRTLDEWTGVNLINPSTAGNWFTNLFGTVRLLRRLSRLLAFRYYNLNRALGAGRSYSNPDGSDTYENEVSLRRLYDDFGNVLDEIAATTALPATPSDPAPSRAPRPTPAGAPAESAESPGTPNDTTAERQAAFDERLDALFDELTAAFKALENDIEDTLVPVDQYHWDDPDIEDDFEKEYRDLMQAELDALEKEIKRLEQQEEAEVAALRADIANAGRTTSFQAAGLSDAAAIQPGREDVETIGLQDKQVKGWIRVTGPHPCAFCSMLASRGTFYLTEASAGRAYHRNCHCSVQPVFKTEPARSARDQFFQDMWGKVASGKPDPLNAWRRWLARAYAQGQVPDQDIYGPARPR